MYHFGTRLENALIKMAPSEKKKKTGGRKTTTSRSKTDGDDKSSSASSHIGTVRLINFGSGFPYHIDEKYVPPEWRGGTSAKSRDAMLRTSSTRDKELAMVYIVGQMLSVVLANFLTVSRAGSHGLDLASSLYQLYLHVVKMQESDPKKRPLTGLQQTGEYLKEIISKTSPTAKQFIAIYPAQTVSTTRPTGSDATDDK